MNVSYEEYNTSDVAQLLGVERRTVTWWCRNGYIKYQDVSGPGSTKPRYLFTVDEVNRVSNLIDKYGKRKWMDYNDLHSADEQKKVVITPQPVVANPMDINFDNTEEVAGYVTKIRALKKQRDKLLEELDALDNAIREMKQKVIEAI